MNDRPKIPGLIKPNLPKQWADFGASIGATHCLCRYYSSDMYLTVVEQEAYAITRGRNDLVFFYGEKWDSRYVRDIEFLSLIHI